MNQQIIDRQYIGKLVSGSMGCFLEPPLHPSYKFCVVSRYYPERGFSMSITSAAECEWLDEETKKQAQDILATWHPLPLTDERTQDWILQVLGYFHHCFADTSKPKDIRWNASELKIQPKRKLPQTIVGKVRFAHEHAGVHHIRKYYPMFIPTEEQMRNAYWGKTRNYEK